ncbi:PepSY domain-containing protein [Aneurinibacillus migulanus]|uniref:Uncharacterized membrane protein YkoI n=1 Tax=Aneurinibacillus migulanus TaxID=47500 RepID=A0A0D1XYU5_ANEMI|nr:PepSY domain-containing protein [Aneurinibacillus migulanus]KIV57258.1 hypothetical protein TS65_10860 [Aneurinibacillus migulanus]KON96847.1 hypothetical protein AF333_16520 [Aneurinibacillus migulanus]MED0895209.1 PepSY domain-containing protein [Aneurinibacillus migulanus]MED1619471.1 PepSY domain-containing protein [Aneurinibacillus migulanus]SDJ58013.1 Uncharacterized membrane protein YkoI [Aneurinibacillus migulanus]
MNKKLTFFLIGLLITVLVAVGARQIFANKHRETLTADQIENKIEKKYPGEVKSIRFSEESGEDLYTVELQNQTGSYEIKADAYSGEVVQLTQVKEKAAKPTTDQAAKGNEQAGHKTKQGIISLDKAKKIALSKVKGRFDSIDLEEEEGTLIYELEVETDKNQEYTIRVNAYTGEVLSVSWED